MFNKKIRVKRTLIHLMVKLEKKTFYNRNHIKDLKLK
jgi:hypothetical protein